MGNCATCQNCNGETKTEFNDTPEGAVIDVRQSRQNLGGANKGYISKTNTKYVRQTRIESLVASRLALQNSC